MALLFDESEVPGLYGHRLGSTAWALELASDHGFRFHCTLSELGGSEEGQGTWALEDDTVVLLPNPSQRLQSLCGTRLIPVKWGRRHLLIEERRMPAFCVDARGQAPPSEVLVSGLDFVKLLAPGEPPGGGDPALPERFREFHEHGAIRAQVARVNDDGTVILDRGSADRLRPGMRLALGMTLELDVVAVEEHQATARPFYACSSEHRIDVGDIFTSGEQWSYPRLSDEERLSEPPPPPPKIVILHKATGEVLDLTGADLDRANLTFARFDCSTRWPDSTDPAAAPRGPGGVVKGKSHVSFQVDFNGFPMDSCYVGQRTLVQSFLSARLSELRPRASSKESQSTASDRDRTLGTSRAPGIRGRCAGRAKTAARGAAAERALARAASS